MKLKSSEIIKRGTCILTEKPFVYALNSKYRKERCDFCFLKTNLLKCTGCNYVYYCGRACQKEAWTIHKIECPCLRRAGSRIIPNAARMLLRIIIKLKQNGEFEKGYYTSTNYRRFKDLMSHYAEIKLDSKRMEHLESLQAVLEQLLVDIPVPNSAELLGLYGRLTVNGFNILDGEMCSLGTGIYLGISIVDHSCTPNAVVVFEGTTLYIRTLQDLPSLNWSEIFISYIDLLNTTEARRIDLKSTYYFLCTCYHCLDDSETKLMNSACCMNAFCDEPIDASFSDKICNKCTTKVSEEHMQTYHEVKEFIEMKLEEMKDIAYLDVCKICLKKMSGILHPKNILYVKILDMAFESAIQMCLWNDAISYGNQLLHGFRLYYGNFHPLLGLLYLKLGKILLLQNQPESLERLKNAQEILKITHGEKHELYKHNLLPLLEQALSESLPN
ncbi:histone-lysine N-methyltransferase SMYD3-like [Ctenocephalides felis]|uniref:histone-lysine N-methyltransferase SMYD3-like n=1 Tax=Ctenocephalides felis TaxID=7515 RepID=UPI000E6E4E7B|nr:histone-lysine N-methyltransferase SMYD3-like [Ctenocephalides felis]